MFRGSNVVKRQQWESRLERFGKSGQTVAAFCRAEAVATPTFYQWKRKLAGLAAIAKSSNHRRRAKSRRAADSPAFKPVRITSPELSLGVNVQLPDGIVIDLGSDLATIEKNRGPTARSPNACGNRNVVLPKSDFGKAFQYIRNHFTELVLYLEDPLLPMDSNETEDARCMTVEQTQDHRLKCSL